MIELEKKYNELVDKYNILTDRYNQQVSRLAQQIRKLHQILEQLKKNAIVWHKVTCFDEPDENGCITVDNPTEEGKDYLLLLTNKRFVISALGYYSDGYFFDDYAWEDIEAWAELPSVGVEE